MGFIHGRACFLGAHPYVIVILQPSLSVVENRQCVIEIKQLYISNIDMSLNVLMVL